MAGGTSVKVIVNFTGRNSRASSREKLTNELKYGDAHLRTLASGLALLAEGLLAKIQKMENRLTAVEGALRRS